MQERTNNPTQSTDVLLPPWQLEPCPTWCIVAHDSGDPVSSRRHESEWATIDRPRLDTVQDYSRISPWAWRPRRTGVRIEQNIVAGNSYSPTVRVCTQLDDGEFPVEKSHGGNWPLIVTATEALELAELVRRVACTAANEHLGQS